LLSRGLSKEDADTISEEYLDGELRGRRCHVFSSLVKFGLKLIGERNKSRILNETGS